jgi:hypothetical protein
LNWRSGGRYAPDDHHWAIDQVQDRSDRIPERARRRIARGKLRFARRRPITGTASKAPNECAD